MLIRGTTAIIFPFLRLSDGTLKNATLFFVIPVSDVKVCLLSSHGSFNLARTFTCAAAIIELTGYE